MSRPEHPTSGAAELEQFLVSLTASRARLEALAGTAEVPELGQLVEEVDVLAEQLLTADAELRAQESELAELSQRAEHAVRRWENMFARSDTAYYLTDVDGVIVNSNLAARRLLHDPETAPTQIRPVASKFDLEDRRAVRAALRRAVAEGATTTVRTATHARPGTVSLPVDVSVTPVHAPGEDVSLWWQIVPVPQDAGASALAASVAQLAEALTAVTQAIHGAGGPQAAMQRIVEVIPQHLPGVEHVGISTVRRGRLATLAATGPVPGQVDEVQYRTGEGPSLDALLHEPSYLSGNVALEDRWPVFARLCVEETPVRSMLGFRLPIDDQLSGTLTCYSSSYDAFANDSQLALAAVFAAQTALAFAAAYRQEKAENLGVALENSRLIGAAVGILMAQHRVTQDQAFELLRQASQRTHRKLRDIAEDVVQTGALG